MAADTGFQGFSRNTLRFFEDLKANNEKEWFEAHKDDYENEVMAPSRAFVIAMGDRLAEIAPDVQAEPKVNGSLFRIHRDTRFSKDKTPYKTNIGIMFWEGEGKRMESSCFYFHLETDSLMLGTGIYMFSKDQLAAYRKAVVDPVYGPALREATAKLGPQHFDRTGCGMKIDQLKKVPPGFDPDHPNAQFLKYKGLHAGNTLGIPEELFSPALIELCFEHYKKLAPLHRWLVEAMGR